MTACRLSFPAALFFGAAAGLFADVRMPTVFGDHMVLQQEAKLPVWGLADPGETVTVTVGTETAQAAAGADGRWRVDLPPLPPGGDPLTVTVAGKNTLTFQDVLVGDVWFCSGQSNMGVKLPYAANAAAEIPRANDARLRFFWVSVGPSLDPSTSLAVGKWEVCTPESASRFSAVGYFFGKELRSRLDRPVGLIGSAWGGTSAEPWTPLSAFQREPALKPDLDQYLKIKEAAPQAEAELPAKMAAFRDAMKKWNDEGGAAYTAALKEWTAASDQAKAAGEPVPPKPQPAAPMPQQPPAVYGGTGTPTVLFNCGVASVIPYAIKGVAWYQGESNAGNPVKYRTLFPALVTGWREAWGQGDFPFLFVQLPKFLQGQNWPLLREAQARALALPRTGMAVIVDLGDPVNIHPTNKLDVGIRLERLAERVAYGKDLVYTGPRFQEMKAEGDGVRLQFTETGGGLVAGTGAAAGAPLAGFAVAGADKKWRAAQARIDGTAVIVSSGEVPQPVAVRYGWENSPECNLYNKEGFPASPFRTDDWAEAADLKLASSPSPLSPKTP